jgi:hypothetical protein
MTIAQVIIQRTKGEKNVQRIAELFTRHFNSRLDLIKKLFWVVVYLSGCILVALTCNDLYQTYQHYPVSVSNANIHSDTITLPDATICLPYFHAEDRIEHELDTEPLKSSGVDCEIYRRDYYVNNTLTFFDSRNNTWEDILGVPWPSWVLYPAQYMLSIIYETETLHGCDKNPWKDLDNATNQTDNVLPAIETVLKPKLVEWNITIGEFRDIFAQKFREFYLMNVTFTSNNGTDDVTDLSEELVFVNKYQVCYKLNLKNVEFTPESSLKIEIKTMNFVQTWCSRSGHSSGESILDEKYDGEHGGVSLAIESASRPKRLLTV